MAKDKDADILGTTLPLRLSDTDVARLDALVRIMPAMSRNALARECLRRGLEAFDAALGEKDETRRLASLARLCGMTAGGRAKG